MHEVGNKIECNNMHGERIKIKTGVYMKILIIMVNKEKETHRVQVYGSKGILFCETNIYIYIFLM